MVVTDKDTGKTYFKAGEYSFKASANLPADSAAVFPLESPPGSVLEDAPGSVPIPPDGTAPEAPACSASHVIPLKECGFLCANDECLAGSVRCDNKKDCADGSDETEEACSKCQK